CGIRRAEPGRRFELLAHLRDLAGAAGGGEIQDDDVHDAQVARRPSADRPYSLLEKPARLPRRTNRSCDAVNVACTESHRVHAVVLSCISVKARKGTL